jgi:release factor glutamine methyltransferase
VTVVKSDDPLVSRLRGAGCVYAEDEARLLRECAANPAELESLTSERVAGRPLEYVLGWAEFCGLRIGVVAGVFVPRARSEVLAELACACLPTPTATVLDLCCGSGAVGAVVASRVPQARVIASDIDPLAVACAGRNLGDRGPVFEGDLFAPIPDDYRGMLALIVANAPYVPTDDIALMPAEARIYESHVALDGGSDGLDLHRRIAAEAAQWLVPGGYLLIETSERQAAFTVRICAERGFAASIRRDDDRDGTVVVATSAPAGDDAILFRP